MILDKFRLTDKVALITGGGRGIGRAIALGFAEAGADVAVCARTLSEVEGVAQEVRGLGRRGLGVRCDARVGEQVNEMVRRTATELGKIDILVNNVGGQFWAKSLEVSEKGWNTLIAENLNSVFLCSQAAAKVMIEQGTGGTMINMSTQGAFTGGEGTAGYAAAKAAVNNLTISLAMEWARYNIRINAIAPGAVWTEGAARILWNTPERKQKTLNHIIRGRFGTAEDIVLACIYLASPASDWITGQTFQITGGLRLYES